SWSFRLPVGRVNRPRRASIVAHLAPRGGRSPPDLAPVAGAPRFGNHADASRRFLDENSGVPTPGAYPRSHQDMPSVTVATSASVAAGTLSRLDAIAASYLT